MYVVSDWAGWHDVCSSRVGAQADGRVARCVSCGWHPTNGRLGRMNGVDVRAGGADTLVIPNKPGMQNMTNQRTTQEFWTTPSRVVCVIVTFNDAGEAVWHHPWGELWI